MTCAYVAIAAFPNHSALPTPSNARITKNIRNEIGIQRLGRGGSFVVGSGIGIAGIDMPSAYRWPAGQ